MFSGIVEELGRVDRNAIATEGRLDIGATAVVVDVAVGDSIAVNGCCLTVVAARPDGFAADVMPETGRRTNLGALAPGDPVNLEGALRYGGRVGGHMVSGHVDAVGTVRARVEEGNAVRVTVTAPAEVLAHVVERGSIAVDGISLTVVAVDDASFTVSLIPHTVAVTTAQRWTPGATVNLESDLVAKHVVRTLEAHLAATRGIPTEARS